MQLLPTDHISTKKQARKLFLCERNSFSEEDIDLMSRSLCNILFEQIKTFDVQTVLLFFPFRQEPTLIPLMTQLLNVGIRTAFPVSHKDEIHLEFRYVESIDDFVDGEYGIKEPNVFCNTVIYFSDCICIVPALAFDKTGMRIGYGKGYYDRFLENFPGVSIGVTFSKFIVSKLPIEEKDIPVDFIVTEKGVIIPDEKKYTPQSRSARNCKKD